VEQQAASYNGMEFALRGDKKRFVLPSAFRKDVVTSSGGERILCLAQHHKYRCITGFGLSRRKSFDSLIASEAARQTALGQDFDIDAYTHVLNSFTPVPFDPSGRFVVPDYLMEICNVDTELSLNGAGDHFTLWAPEELYAMGPMFDGAKAACRLKRAAALAAKKK